MKGSRIPVAFVLMAVVLLSGCSRIDDWVDPLIQDEQLLNDFDKRKEHLNKIRKFFEQNPSVRYIFFASECRSSVPKGEGDLKGVCETLEELGSSWAENEIAGPRRGVFVKMDGRYLGQEQDLTGVSDGKGYVYSRNPLAPSFESLDDRSPADQYAFRSVGEEWSLYYARTYSKPE